MNDKPLTDDELEELMYLYRVTRAGNATKKEVDRLDELFRRFRAQQEKERKVKQ